MDVLVKVVVVAALLGAGATANASTFDFSYTFGDGQDVTGEFSGEPEMNAPGGNMIDHPVTIARPGSPGCRHAVDACSFRIQRTSSIPPRSEKKRFQKPKRSPYARKETSHVCR